MSVFEVGMLVCFGAAWPINIAKSIKSKTTAGRSLIFQWAILLGYVSGIIHKLLYSKDVVLYLYFLNFAMISFDLCLGYRNKMLDKKRKKEGKE